MRDFCAQVFRKIGVPDEDARCAADVLVTADLRGIESHGIARLGWLYARRILAGGIVPCPQVRVLNDLPVAATIDGGGGLGPPIARRAMQLAIAKARQAGAGFVTVRNSNHFGIAGYYAMMALEHDCIGLCMSGTNPWVVPTFGADAILGTNPMAVAIPAGAERPFVLDMATSAVPIGKLQANERLGRPIPAEWATDERGLPTTDPGLVLRNVRGSVGGGLLPLGGAGEETGGHKGYGLAMWVEIFTALLAGAPLAQPADHPESAGGDSRMTNVSHFFGAWRVDAFRPVDEFRADMDTLLRRMKSSRKADGQTRIYVAGEKEFEAMERRRRDGIPVPKEVVADLQQLGSELGVKFPGDASTGSC
ncbi:MAG: Ldh family oxidoreductase [Phycisphaerae bacterium]|nr:Ldh family oxidoreductase [Phycisphaerae bacterium]